MLSFMSRFLQVNFNDSKYVAFGFFQELLFRMVLMLMLELKNSTFRGATVYHSILSKRYEYV